MSPVPTFTRNANSGSNVLLQDKACPRSTSPHIESGHGQRIPSGICEEWPTHLNSPLAWNHCTIHKEADFTYSLSGTEIVEAESALAHFKSTASDSTSARILIYVLIAVTRSWTGRQ